MIPRTPSLTAALAVHRPWSRHSSALVIAALSLFGWALIGLGAALAMGWWP